MGTYTIRAMKVAILEALLRVRQTHKINLIGRTGQQGDLEQFLHLTFSPSERQLASIAFEQLKANSEIRPTFNDLIDPESWVEITDTGREVLKRSCRDDLDTVLERISPILVEIREGAWSAAVSGRPDSLRQAAHSARELIDQTLKEGAPDESIREMVDFQREPSSRSGITRRHRLQYLMRLYRGSESDSELRVVEEACNLVLAVDDRLKALAHFRQTPSAQEVQDSLQVAEIALRRVLISATRPLVLGG